MKKLTPFLLLLLILGCGESKVDSPTAATGAEITSTTADTTGGETPAVTQTMTQADVDKIPAELKHEAFKYYGLSGLKVVDYEMVQADQTYTGAAMFHLKEIGEDRSIVDVEYTGGLGDQMGTVTYAIVPGGLDVIGMSKGELGAKSVRDMPANPKAGDSWKSKFTMTMGDHKLASDLTYTVKGVEKVKTKAGEFDALRVDFSGKVTTDGKTSPTSASIWFVKDVGMVKSEVRTKTENGDVERVIEATKVS